MQSRPIPQAGWPIAPATRRSLSGSARHARVGPRPPAAGGCHRPTARPSSFRLRYPARGFSTDDPGCGNLRGVPAKKTDDLLVLAGDIHRRQGGDKHSSVPLPHHPWITDHDGTKIVFAADEAPNTLLEREGRLRKLIIPKRIAAGGLQMLDARPDQGIIRRSERQLLDDHQAQGLALHIDTFPETGGAQQDCVAILAKLFQQPLPRRLTLNVQLIGWQLSPTLPQQF